MPEPCSLRVEDLHKRFGGRTVLRGLGFSIEKGQCLLVTGPNGSGKSTLLRCLAGLAAASRGSVEFRLGERAIENTERRAAIGYQGPDLELYADLTARENLAFFARLGSIPDAGARIAGLVDALAIPADVAFGALSSGQRQRVRWALALLRRPRFLFLDEPFQNLDAEGASAAGALLTAHLESGLAILASPVELPWQPPENSLVGLDLVV